MKHQTGGTVWPSGNILELFLTAMLAAVTLITNVCDDAQNIRKSTDKNWGAGVHDTRGYVKSARTLTCRLLMLLYWHRTEIRGERSLRPPG